MTGVRIQFAGELRVEAQNVVLETSRLGGTRARLVFAFLVLERSRVVSRDELAEAVWGDRLPSTWGPALRNVVSRVRAFVRDAASGVDVVSDATGCYRLVWGADLDVDVEAMERSLEQARAEFEADEPGRAVDLAESALEVARRPFLPGLEGRWVDHVRARQRDALGAGLELIAEAALHRDPSASVDAARELIALDRVSEEGYRLLMGAEMGAGNRAGALAAYMACRAALAEELGVEPSAATQQTYLSILRSAGGDEDLERSETRFAEVGGSRIAYQTAGAGAVDVVFVAGSFTHVDAIWQDAAPAAFFSHFLPSARLVFFDPAGTGASDPVRDRTRDETTRRVEELRHVLDAAGASRPVVVASLDGGPGALRFAATSPERVQALVLVNTTSRWLRADDYEEGLSPAVAETIVRRVSETWGTEDFAAHAYPALRGDRRFLAWYARLQRTMTSPRSAGLAMRRLEAIDERAALPRIAAPTLVLHRREHRAFPLSQGRYLAEHIRGARLEVLNGSEGLFGEDSYRLAAKILEFAVSTHRGRARRR